MHTCAAANPSGVTGMFRILDIDHVVLRVSDLVVMIDFYSGVLGCSVEWRRPDLVLSTCAPATP